MRKEEQNKLDAFFKASFQQNLESALPNHDFTDKVLHKLNKSQAIQLQKHKPLLGKKIKWSFGLFMGLLFLCSLYVAFNSPNGSSYELPPSVVNLLSYYGSLFNSANNWLMLISAVTLGFWSLMLLDKIVERVSFG